MQLLCVTLQLNMFTQKSLVSRTIPDSCDEIEAYIPRFLSHDVFRDTSKHTYACELPLPVHKHHAHFALQMYNVLEDICKTGRCTHRTAPGECAYVC